MNHKYTKVVSLITILVLLFSIVGISLSPYLSEQDQKKKETEALKIQATEIISKYKLDTDKDKIFTILNNLDSDKKSIKNFIQYITSCEVSEKDKTCKNIIPFSNF